MEGLSRHYERPTRLDSALGLLQDRDTQWTILAGGTDIFPTLTNELSWHGATPRSILDIGAISELAGITEQENGYRIGSLATWRDVMEAQLPRWFDCLKEAGREVGGPQIQNRATVIGNVCNASPAADGIPALLSLGAELELSSRSRVRTVPMNEFVMGNRQTMLEPDEIVSSLLIPKYDQAARSSFLKLGIRRYLVISIAAVSALLEPNDKGEIDRAQIAIGACSAAAMRLPELENALLGTPMTASISDIVTPQYFNALTPIDDVRATASYRTHAARELTARALASISGGS